MKPKFLQKLIKKIQKEIDQARIEKIEVERKIDALHIRIKELQEELVKEQIIVASTVEFSHTYENFYKTNKVRQKNIKDEIKRCEGMVEEIEEKLFDLFRTLKQYEILLNRYFEDKKERLEAAEGKFLDEIGIRRAGQTS